MNYSKMTQIITIISKIAKGQILFESEQQFLRSLVYNFLYYQKFLDRTLLKILNFLICLAKKYTITIVMCIIYVKNLF
jgi:hypothetical protein